MDTATWYRGFGELEARGQSAIYEEWALGVADDPTLIALIDELPLQKRQPNLIFACARLLGAPEADYQSLRGWLLQHWSEVVAEALARSTQTNEARRCASLLPALALIPGPLALLEVGASAGLCLFPDRYSYSYDGGTPIDPPAGPSSVQLECATTGGVPRPTEVPDVVWRAGIDLRPLAVGNADDMRWLETLVWPEQHERRARLRAAIRIAAADPPRVVRGDASELATLAAQAPHDATLVVITSAVLVYLPFAERMRLVDVVRALDARWISLEGLRGLPIVRAALPDDGGSEGRFVLALDETPLAFTGAQGQSLDWIATP
ncbi:DUF2332 domain-containing protein [Glaciihabitans sp. INWT7]|uniref:DUF2332 domain-containing protein n=1 Tax=Glaciihabitans sp. INWT7 TaxID=2596912 RepID=UPI001625211B|nr:DUF2332 domain-containing protein [Glaciihabitans sp. INWT7]QNE47794.1 DUF2332 domain-containing protein [Glaciihabitans sp. INWT7]